MSAGKPPQITSGLESGFVAIPIQASETGSLRLSLVTRVAPDPATGHAVLLRVLPQAKVLLGCLQDHAGEIHDWLEIWIQEPSVVQPEAVPGPTNAQRDQEWQRLAATLRATDQDAHISSAFETEPPLPIFLDVKARSIVHPHDGADGWWQLCRDDQLLAAADLPGYSSSAHRYLYLPAKAEQSHFIPVNPDAPANDKTAPLASIADAENTPINPASGLMFFRKFAPVGLEEYADLLACKPWRGVENARAAIRLNGVYRTLQDESELRCGAAHLFSGAAGRGGRFSEVLHLKLQIVAQAGRLVREYIRQTQLPLLNLTADTFRVRLYPSGAGLPLLWTAQATLDKPGAAVALPIANSKTRYFRSTEPFTPSIYRPEALGLSMTGVASIRIRKVLPPVEEGIVAEGTFATQERIHPDRNDLVSIQLPVTTGVTTLYGYLDRGENLPQGELRLRTIPQILTKELEAALRAVEGIPFNNVRFEIVPPLSSPCDLYSLAVLAIRVLLVNPQTSLPYALDAMLSLARQLANEYDEAQPLGDRLRKIFDADPQWLAALGPQHLLHDEIAPDEAANFLPLQLWLDVLGAIVRFFPGLGPDSVCRDFGDAPALACEQIFDQPLHQLEQLGLRSRSLLLLNWKQHVEIVSVIRSIEESLP